MFYPSLPFLSPPFQLNDQAKHILFSDHEQAQKLQRLSETVSSTYVASDTPIRQSRKLLIDLGQFFEILEYSSSSELSHSNSSKQLFGRSLRTGGKRSREEGVAIAQTSVLPMPTRVEGQEFRGGGGSLGGTPRVGFGNDLGGGGGPGSVDSMAGVGLEFSNDELAVLAESFFHQRGEFEGSGGNWWNGGGL